MRPDIQERLIRVGRNMDRLAHIERIYKDAEGENPREVVANAAVVAAEIVAAYTGNLEDVGAIHRAYEEIFSALESSPAVQEMFSWAKTASFSNSKVSTNIANFRARMNLRSAAPPCACGHGDCVDCADCAGEGCPDE